MTNTLTIHKGGTGEREIEIRSITVPDLWHVATRLREAEQINDVQMVMDCWHLAHAMKDHLQQQEHDLDFAFNEGMKAAENAAAVKEICDNADQQQQEPEPKPAPYLHNHKW